MDWSQLLVPAALRGLAFLMRSFVGGIEGSIKDLKGAIDRLDGRFEAIQMDVHRNTTETAVTRKELQAVWRHIDGAHKRASDLNGGE